MFPSASASSLSAIPPTATPAAAAATTTAPSSTDSAIVQHDLFAVENPPAPFVPSWFPPYMAAQRQGNVTKGAFVAENIPKLEVASSASRGTLGVYLLFIHVSQLVCRVAFARILITP